MKFGKEFKTHLEDTIPEWRDKFLCYKPLKKLLKNFPPNPSPAGAGGGGAFNIGDPRHQLPPQLADDHLQGPNRPSVVNLQEWFIRILNQELEKFNDFYVDKEEDFVIRLQELKGRIRSLKEKCCRDGVFTSESEFSEEMIEIRRDLVTIHGEMVLLKTYSSLNFAGLLKILKKYDKRTGGLLRLPFTQLALRQPFFTTEPLSRLVRECAANLELLFPLQAEVIESANDQDTSNPPLNAAEKLSPETSSDVGKETMHIYQSTLAAMKAIRGLQKASSTYNPLSFSFLFNGQGDDSTSDVTAENSASNSPVTSQNKEVEEEEEEDVSSD